MRKIDDAQRAEDEGQSDSAESEISSGDQTVECRLPDGDGPAQNHQRDSNDHEGNGEPNRDRRVRRPEARSPLAFDQACAFQRVTQRRQLA